MTLFDESTFFPRLEVGDVPAPLAEHCGKQADQIVDTPFDLRKADFHPQGSVRVDADVLLAWRSAMNEWAWSNGFPASMDREAQSRWDVALGRRLLDDVETIPELLHPRVWCWLATNLFPHLVVHRWGWPSLQDGNVPLRSSAWRRFGDRPENGLRLALHRVLVFGEDLALRASEQEFQSLRNRPAYGSDPRVARVVLQALVDAYDDSLSEYGKNGGTRALDANHVCIELRLVNSLQPLAFMGDDEIVSLVSSVVDRLGELRSRTDG